MNSKAWLIIFGATTIGVILIPIVLIAYVILYDPNPVLFSIAVAVAFAGSPLSKWADNKYLNAFTQEIGKENK